MRGTGPGAARSSVVVAVHPRACGERFIGRTVEVKNLGSSPRMRGTAPRLGRSLRRFRFIPAHAGNGLPVQPLHRDKKVHPRACGERSVPIKLKVAVAGSSPRMRGTELCKITWCTHLRFIPAHAGNGMRAVSIAPVTPVHPRACGERDRARFCFSFSGGSSPRVRGTEAWRMPL